MILAPQEDRTFFLTSITWERRFIFASEPHCELFLDVLRDNRGKQRFALHEFVLMRDHFHLLLTPAPLVSLEKAMQFIKGGFSYRLRGRPPVWQASFTNHRVRDLEDYENHREYIRMNPVRARLAERAEEYPYSSAAGGVRMDPVPRG